MKKEKNCCTVVAALVFLDGNPHTVSGGPNPVTYLSISGARRSARQEAARGHRVELRETLGFDEKAHCLRLGARISF